MNRRVVVTGMSGIAPIGSGWKEVRENLLAGRSGVVRMDAWDGIAGLRARVAAPVPGFAAPPDWPRHKTRSMGRDSLLATRASELALVDAGLLGHPALGDGRTGVAYGCTQGSPRALEVYARQFYGKQTTSGIRGSDFIRFMSHTCAANIAQFFGLKGRIIPATSACTSGSQGIGYAYEAIRFGRQDVMIAGGAEEIDGIDAAIFDILLAASTRNDEPERTPRPFDAGRDGVVVAEGAGSLVLEELEFARARGARIAAEVIGYGTNCDGLHMTNPSADGMEQVMRLSLADAGLEPDAVDYVNAHATGTEVGDIAESEATLRVFGPRVPVSTLKGHTGHTLGACGAIEAWISLEMVREGWIAPTRSLEQPDPRCAPLDYVMGAPRAISAETIVSNNFAFGGVNTSLVFRRWRED
ncbi:MAG: beta-ketoacyl-ACP synthase [Deltaproteobacteria bacterium]|nr:MAG: beta-ketoacyl-ACP synthase [Deltaproteobacteria bacterium]